MGQILEIIGIVVLAAALVGFLMVRWGRVRMRKIFQLGNHLKGLPPKIHLVPEPHPKWYRPRQVEETLSKLRKLGFNELGTFRVPAMGNLLMVGFRHPSEPILALMYDHKSYEVTTDFSVYYQDGSGLTVTNAQFGNFFEARPNHERFFDRSLNIQQLFELVRAKIKPKPPLPVSPKNFSKLVEKEYAADFAWLHSSGGINRESISHALQEAQLEVEDEQLENLVISLQSHSTKILEYQAIQAFLERESLSAVWWEEYGSRVFALFKSMTIADVEQALQKRGLRFSLEQTKALEALLDMCDDTRKAFREFNKKNGQIFHCRFLGSVKFPVEADLYKAPDPWIVHQGWWGGS